jgi:hypothetical protein
MKHIKSVTVVKAADDCDLTQWFTDLWDEISTFFKDLFGGDAV